METLANDPDGLAQRKQQERRQHHRTKVAVEIELRPEAASVPLKDIGNQLVHVIGGSGDAGTVLHMKGHTGVIRITTTTAKAGECTRAIGTMRTMTTATGETTIIATIMITAIMITAMTTDC